MSSPAIDYDALAKQAGAVDYDAIAKQAGAVQELPPAPPPKLDARRNQGMGKPPAGAFPDADKLPTPHVFTEGAQEIANTAPVKAIMNAIPETPRKAIKGTAKGILGLADTMSSPGNIALMQATGGMSALAEGGGLLAQAAKYMAPAVRAGFGADMAKNLYDRFPEFKAAWDSKDPELIAKAATEASFTAFMAWAGVAHGGGEDLLPERAATPEQMRAQSAARVEEARQNPESILGPTAPAESVPRGTSPQSAPSNLVEKEEVPQPTSWNDRLNQNRRANMLPPLAPVPEVQESIEQARSTEAIPNYDAIAAKAGAIDYDALAAKAGAVDPYVRDEHGNPLMIKGSEAPEDAISTAPPGSQIVEPANPGERRSVQPLETPQEAPVPPEAPITQEPSAAPVVAAPAPEVAPSGEAAATTPVEVTPVPPGATPERLPSRLAQSVQEKAVEAKLTTGFEDLPEYDKVNVKDQAAKATDLVTTDPERAKRIAMGAEAPPDGLLPESVFTAVEQQATADKDVETLRRLATESNLSSTATAMGQRIRMLAERNPDSAVASIQKVADARQVRAVRELGNDPQRAQVKVIKEQIRKVARQPKTWNDFLDSIKCG